MICESLRRDARADLGIAWKDMEEKWKIIALLDKKGFDIPRGVNALFCRRWSLSSVWTIHLGIESQSDLEYLTFLVQEIFHVIPLPEEDELDMLTPTLQYEGLSFKFRFRSRLCVLRDAVGDTCELVETRVEIPAYTTTVAKVVCKNGGGK